MGTIAPLTRAPRNSVGCLELLIITCVTHVAGDRVISNTNTSKMSYFVHFIGENTLKEE